MRRVRMERQLSFGSSEQKQRGSNVADHAALIYKSITSESAESLDLPDLIGPEPGTRSASAYS